MKLSLLLFSKTLLRHKQSMAPLLRPVTVRHKIWINKLQPPEWMYAEQEDLMNVELAKCLDTLKQGEKAPYLIIDLREQSERELMDIPKYTKVKRHILL